MWLDQTSVMSPGNLELIWLVSAISASDKPALIHDSTKPPAGHMTNLTSGMLKQSLVIDFYLKEHYYVIYDY